MVEITNEKLEEVTDGWLVLDFHSDTKKFHLKLEYHDGDVIELANYQNYVRALKRFKDEAEKL